MTAYYKTSVSNYLYKEQMSFIQRKSGQLIPSGMVVKPIYDLRNNELNLIAYIKERSNSKDYFLIDETGKITGTTEGISTYFKWSPGFFQTNEVFIQNLLPSIYDFFATLHALKMMGRQMSEENFEKALLLTRNQNGLFKCRFYNNTKNFPPYPDLSFIQKADLLQMNKTDLEDIYLNQKLRLMAILNNSTNKYDIEFELELLQIRSLKKLVVILRVDKYFSLDQEYFMPIRSDFTRKVCRIMLVYIKLKRNLRRA